MDPLTQNQEQPYIDPRPLLQLNELERPREIIIPLERPTSHPESQEVSYRIYKLVILSGVFLLFSFFSVASIYGLYECQKNGGLLEVKIFFIITAISSPIAACISLKALLCGLPD